MRNSLLIALVMMLCVTCDNSSERELNSETSSENETKYNGDESMFDKSLLSFLISYGLEVDSNFFDKENLYYNLFFFKRERETYFTIWTFTVYPPPIVFREDIENNCSHCMYRVKERKVLLIFNQMDSLEHLFLTNDDCFSNAKTESQRESTDDIYDGSMYSSTYKISQINSELEFVRQDSVEMPFKW
jgi:hypothetical protein